MSTNKLSTSPLPDSQNEFIITIDFTKTDNKNVYVFGKRVIRTQDINIGEIQVL